jgi:O-antigen ligase
MRAFAASGGFSRPRATILAAEMSTPEVSSGPARQRPAAAGDVPSGGGRSLRDLIAGDPVAIPALAAIALLVVWASSDGGYPQTHWAPGGLILLALLAIAVGVVGVRRAQTPTAVRVALAALAAYTAFSFLSILWAKVQADAWEGADRTLVYLLIFALFATWRRTSESAAALLGAWVLAMSGLAIFTVLHVDGAAGDAARIQALMPGGRLIYPAGYTNANAAMWMMPAFVGLLLASARRVPWLGRGLLAGGSVALVGVALYSQSRGSVFSTPIVLALVFLLLPGRVRAFATLVPIAAGVAGLASSVLRLDERVEVGANAVSAAHSATVAVIVAAVAVALVVAIAGAIESRLALSERAGARVHRGVGLAGVAVLLALIVGGAVAVGKPIGRIEHEWKTFTSSKGYNANEQGGSRLTSGLGSGRSDIYRVAWHEFVTHPVVGIGADNFAVPYLRLRHSDETPHYPHSVELRTLAETGVVGAVIALIGLVAALLACVRALRTSDRLRSAAAAAALAGFGYWVVHGSFDWFFEYAALGGAAFALLGIACSLSPAEAAGIKVSGPLAVPRWTRGRRVAPALIAAIGAAVLVLAAAASLAAPWLSRMEVERAARIWPAAPNRAYATLHEAAELNPLSDEPYLVAGSIALRLEDLGRARSEFALALKRTPEESYATLELGAIASARGERANAIRLLARAVALDPLDPLSRSALATTRKGGAVDVQALNSTILGEAERF